MDKAARAYVARGNVLLMASDWANSTGMSGSGVNEPVTRQHRSLMPSQTGPANVSRSPCWPTS
jgi:hypothetical protein